MEHEVPRKDEGSQGGECKGMFYWDVIALDLKILDGIQEGCAASIFRVKKVKSSQQAM